jgi:hypothetical protein
MLSTLVLSQEQIKRIGIDLLTIFRDPDFVVYFMHKYLSLELSRSFHCSLRLKPSDRWSRLNNLCKKREFSKISPNSNVPITCCLPIDGERWRAQKKLLTQITYFRGYFIRCNSDYSAMPKDDKTKPSDKIRIINYMGRYGHTSLIVREAYKEYLEYEEDLDYNGLPEYYFYQESPQLIYNSNDISGYQILN